MVPPIASVVPAPGSFCTTMVRPSVFDMWSAMMRVVTSTMPPAPEAQMMVMLRSGYAAAAGDDSATNIATRANKRDMRTFLSDGSRRPDDETLRPKLALERPARPLRQIESPALPLSPERLRCGEGEEK